MLMENTNSYSRREFVKLAGMAGAAALIAPNFAFEEAKKKEVQNRLHIHPLGIWRR